MVISIQEHSLVKEVDCLNTTWAPVHCYKIITSEIMWIKRLVAFMCLFVGLCHEHISGSLLEPQGDWVYGKGCKSEALLWHLSVSSSAAVTLLCLLAWPCNRSTLAEHLRKLWGTIPGTPAEDAGFIRWTRKLFYYSSKFLSSPEEE